MAHSVAHEPVENADRELIVLVGTVDNVAIDLTTIQKHIRRFISPESSAVLIAAMDGFKNSFDIHIGDRRYTILHVNKKLEERSLSRAIESSIAWADARAAVGSSEHHFVVAPFLSDASKHSPVILARDLTLITAGLLQCCKPKFICWGSADLLCEPTAFARQAIALAQTNQPPLLCWLNFRPHRAKEGPSAIYTYGLRAFISRELIVIESKTLPDIMSDCIRIVEYIIRNGDVIGDQEILQFENTGQLGAEIIDGNIVVSDKKGRQ